MASEQKFTKQYYTRLHIWQQIVNSAKLHNADDIVKLAKAGWEFVWGTDSLEDVPEKEIADVKLPFEGNPGSYL